MRLIDDTLGLERLADDLSREESLSVDLEADSLHHYREKVCLLQVSTTHRNVLIDTLALRDLAPLRPVFADPAVRKVFHSGDYDLRSLWRDFRIEVHGLFDTQIAAQLLGEEKIGLSDLLARHFGIELDKRFQRADWSLRPLSPEMVAYAVEDTRHLKRLAALLEKTLVHKGRLAWADEEFSLMEKVRPSAPSEEPLYLRVKGADLLNRRGLAILDELARWREKEAARRDVPPFKVMPNAALMELVRLTPADRPALKKARELHGRTAERYGGDILDAVARGLAVPERLLPSWPRRERRERDPEAEARLKHLKTWRTAEAARLGVQPGILINNAVLEELSRRPPHSLGDLGRFPAMKAWQRRELGAGILGALTTGSPAT